MARLPLCDEWLDDKYDSYYGRMNMSTGTSPIDAVLADEGVVTTDQAKLAADEAADQAAIATALATEGTDDAAAYAAVTAAGSPAVHLVVDPTTNTVTGAYLCTAVAPVPPATTGTVTIASIPLV